jgi:hypothetical protein
MSFEEQVKVWAEAEAEIRRQATSKGRREAFTFSPVI